MSQEKREQLIAEGKLDETSGDRPTHVVTPEEAGTTQEQIDAENEALLDPEHATADADVVVADTVDPSQEA